MSESVLEAPLQAASATPAPRVIFPLEFRGSGAEYFRIWIVNLLLTLLTLGIFSAWAKVRRLRYFYGNTVLADHTFEYHARPGAILKGRLIVFAVYLLFLIGVQFYQPLLFVAIPLAAFGMPWMLLRSRRFQLRMTSWRNLRFSFGGTYRGALIAYMGWFLLLGAGVGLAAAVSPNGRMVFLILLGVMLAYPFWVHKRIEYSLDHSSYGRSPFGFLTGIGRFYGICIATAVMSIVAYLLFALLFFQIPSLQEAVKDAMQHGEQLQNLDLVIASGPFGWLLLVVGAMAGFAIAGFYKAKMVNATFNGLQLGAHQFVAELRPTSLMWIQVTNLLAMLVTLGVFYPWAKVRLLRYQLENIRVDSDGRVDEFAAADGTDATALGEEASDFFNVDLGL